MQYGETFHQGKFNSSLEVISFLCTNVSGYNFEMMNLHYIYVFAAKPTQSYKKLAVSFKEQVQVCLLKLKKICVKQMFMFYVYNCCDSFSREPEFPEKQNNQSFLEQNLKYSCQWRKITGEKAQHVTRLQLPNQLIKYNLFLYLQQQSHNFKLFFIIYLLSAQLYLFLFLSNFLFPFFLSLLPSKYSPSLFLSSYLD